MRRDEALVIKDDLARELFPEPALPVERVVPFGLRPRGRAMGRSLSLRVPTLGHAVRRAAHRRVVRPTLALGVTAELDGGHRLAVRIQAHGPETDRALKRIRQQTDDVDIEEIGRVVKRADTSSWRRSRQRPLRIGSSIGHAHGESGTLGCFVRQPDGPVQVLSNNHVLAAENAARMGDLVVQPGPEDAGQAPGDVVGELSSFIELQAFGINRVDCALATVQQGVDVDAALKPGVRTSGVAAPQELVGVEVMKVGRTTGETCGVVTVVGLDNVVVEYDLGDVRFDDVLQVDSADNEPFSDEGDSGSVIFTADTHAAVGLLFAGTQLGGSNDLGRTFAHPMATVLEELGAQLVP